MSKELTAEAIEAAFAAPGIRLRNRRCVVGRLIEEYPVLEPKIMDVTNYSSATVHRVLKSLDLGTAPSDKAITVHRKGVCICPKEATA